MSKLLNTLFILLLGLTILPGCSKNIDSSNYQAFGQEFFVSATASGTYPKDILKSFATSHGFREFVSQIKYDVDFLKVVYKTTYKGKSVEASGLLAIPKNTTEVPSLLSAQHGTIFKFADAPSNFPAAFSGFELVASAGFVTVIPDYLGFGVSKSIIHPYYDQQHSALAVVDMLKAVKYYLQKEKISISNRLFLFGYSEGGFVTMAAQKEIETHPEHQLSLTAAAEGAGGYDLTGMLATIATTATYSDPSYLAFIIQSYNTTYNWSRPYTDFFQPTYANKIPSLLNGAKSQAEINAGLTTSTTALFNPAFLENLQDPGGEQALKQAVSNNSFLDWFPKVPTRLYHGTADATVFYQTSQTTFNRFKSSGATNVEFISIQNGNHQTSIKPMVENMLSWFRSLDK